MQDTRLIAFLNNLNEDNVQKEVNHLVEKIELELPHYNYCGIIIITNIGFPKWKNISHPRIKTSICAGAFQAKKDIDYILIYNESSKSDANKILEALGRKRILPTKVYEISEDIIKEIV